jgi:single-stranded-DNA-specific exonuclease
LRFGGHSQAAGLKMKKNKADEFYKKAEEIISSLTPAQSFVPTLDIDAEITPEDINWDFMGMLKKMEPFGEGNPEPVFLMKNMQIFDLKVCGNGSKHLKLSIGAQSGSPRFDEISHRVGAGSSKVFDSIGFSMCEKFPNIKKNDVIDVVFNLAEDSWNGNKKMQLKLIDIKER